MTGKPAQDAPVQDAGGEIASETAGALAPLRVPLFRRIWSSSVCSNLGHQILGVAAAWEMTRLSSSPTMIASVQTALMLPLMLVALPAGALADMFDRRRIAMAGLGLACLGGIVMAVVGLLGLVTPWLILALLLVIGSGVALYGPAWQASIGELVPPRVLPAAVALGSVSYNIARSVGPALGGFLVLAAGAHAAFSVNALGYVPLLLAFFFWRRTGAPSRLPPESLGRALVSGMRYAAHAGAVRNAVVRVFVFGLCVATATALAPLIARDQLAGNASTYGILLGAGGIGAILGSLSTATMRERFGPEIAVRIGTGITALALVGIALSRDLWLAALCFALQGMGTMLVLAMFNVGVQLAAPRWVTARALSLYSSAVTGGIALGAMGWGAVTNALGLQAAVLASGALLAASILLGLVLPMVREGEDKRASVTIGHDPQVALALTARSGPVEIEIDYRVEPGDARAFYRAMQDVGKARRRNGGFGWSLARDIADPCLWTERYECPTWGDYLHMRERFTEADRDLQHAVEAFNTLKDDARLRRRLLRPSGSVRWAADAPDPGEGSPRPFTL
ncbi:MFS transporter [Novosphingobium aureum]|uniref:MFS transporter n=1 Tax=Novosphingobium aureum TaxID=2792964 RepID=UPI002B49068A|nr:MFS transporter [Novosphingobium aureum]